MASKALKFRVGIFAAASLGLLAIVVVVFAGFRFWEGRDHYYIVFEDSVMGLENGARVHLNGMPVGTVGDIGVDPVDLRKVRVKISVKEGTPIHSDTRAMLQYAGITGLKVIDLREGTRTSPRLAVNSQIVQGQTVIDKLQKTAEVLADQSTQLMTRANKIVENLVVLSDPKRYEAMDEIIIQAKVTSENLAVASNSLKGMVAENRVALRTTIASVNDAANSATAILDGQVSQILTNAGDFVSELKGMVSNNQSALRSAVFDLRQASRSFKELAREVRQRPSRLFFSSAPSERKLP